MRAARLRFSLPAAALLLAALPAAASDDDERFSLDRYPPTTATEVYAGDEPPEVEGTVVGEEGREAVTVCDFWCKPTLSYRTLATSVEGDRCKASIELVETNVVLELSMRTWLHEEASKLLRRHEAAHRQICEDVYAGSERPVRAAAETLFTERVTGEGTTCRQAVEDAVSRRAAVQLCGLYQMSRAAQAQRVVDIYDAIVRDPRLTNMEPKTAIKHAFRIYEREALEQAALTTLPALAPAAPAGTP